MNPKSPSRKRKGQDSTVNAKAAPTIAETLVIENISPQIENGKYAVKRLPRDELVVEADIFKDGHDVVCAAVQWRPMGSHQWAETPMEPLENDRWSGQFPLESVGFTEYRIVAWGNPFLSWCEEIRKKVTAGVTDLSVETLEGVALVTAAAARASTEDSQQLAAFADSLRDSDPPALARLAANPLLSALMAASPDRALESCGPVLRVWTDRSEAGFSAWYEFFPRSAGGHGDRGSTFRECLDRVDDARAMGFDVVYFPPIHPIGVSNRKGRNNSLICEPGDPGVPYAIGNSAQGVNGGGHKDVAPELGTLQDFEWLVGEVRSRGMEVALDFAINCSPDHPYVKAHPDWFFHRPDGSIKHAENPPKKYEDVYPLNFHNPDWRGLWEELCSVVAFWCARGVRIFRVDNPHTKPVAFWEWLIAQIQRDYPDTIFLSEAFTRPKMMQVLAKVGFTQSYTYFTWRNTKPEIEAYLAELTESEMRDYFRPNFFVNTPDILPFYLQTGGRPAFCIRAILAATLSPVYGIYSGFELCENTPIPGKEEYFDSEKYHFRARDWNAAGNIKDLLTKLNALRREHRCFRELRNIRFHHAENDQILLYEKFTPANESPILVAVSLDPFNSQSAFVNLPLAEFGIGASEPYVLDDLLTGETFRWCGSRNYIALDPHTRPAHIFRLRRRNGRVRGQEVFC